MTNVGEEFGQRRPPLFVTIKQILDKYPDGQIFKVVKEFITGAMVANNGSQSIMQKMASY